MQMRDGLGSIYSDDQFAYLYAADGQPGISPWRLVLVTVMQFAENLSDRQAADAVPARLVMIHVPSYFSVKPRGVEPGSMPSREALASTRVPSK